MIPRKNSRQWRTIIYLISNDKWVDNTGEGHQEFIDDVSRLKEKGWPILTKDNEDGFSKSYKLDREQWVKISPTIERFW